MKINTVELFNYISDQQQIGDFRIDRSGDGRVKLLQAYHPGLNQRAVIMAHRVDDTKNPIQAYVSNIVSALDFFNLDFFRNGHPIQRNYQGMPCINPESKLTFNRLAALATHQFINQPRGITVRCDSLPSGSSSYDFAVSLGYNRRRKKLDVSCVLRNKGIPIDERYQEAFSLDMRRNRKPVMHLVDPDYTAEFLTLPDIRQLFSKQ